MKLKLAKPAATIDTKVFSRVNEQDGKEMVACVKHLANVFNEEASWSVEHGVTASLLSDYLLCPQKVQLGYVERLKPKVSKDYLEWGNLIHAAQEYMRSAGKIKPEVAHVMLTDYMAQSYADARKKFIEDGETQFQSLEERYGTAQVVLEEFAEFFGPDTREWHSLESEFDVKYNGIRLRGKRDGIYKTANGYGLQEDKTKGRIDEDLIFDKLHFDTQVMLYLLSMEKEDLTPTEVTYSVIRSPQLKRKQAETLKDFLQRIREDIKTRPEFYFIVKRVEISPEDMLAWKNEFDDQLNSLCTGVFFRNSSACGAYGVTCQFFPICTRNDRSEFIKKEQIFMELSDGR